MHGRHDLAAFQSERGETENLVAFRVDDRFQEAARLAHFHGTRHVAHRQPGSTHGATLPARLGFSQT
ncbi:MAG TPA: hypothetical protein VK356_06025, partial [Thermomicrobiales bacterium]|nr:hypothetical protein [Thermomicrobiales bacterium]